MSARKWNPLFAAYARAHKRTPAGQLAHDETTYPGGKMCGFILWIAQCRALFKPAHPECFLGDTITDLATWTRFVQGCARKGLTLIEGP